MKSIGSRIALALMSVGLVVFSLTLNSPTNAQDKDTCAGEGWQGIDASEVNLEGTFAGTQNRDCIESAKWQFSFPLVITREGGEYMAHIGSEPPQPFKVSGSRIRFVRDLKNGAGEDKKGVRTQTWSGRIERHRNGGIRIYGVWSGAFDYTNENTDFNHDFMIIIK